MNYYNGFSLDKSNKEYSVSFSSEFLNSYKNKVFISPSESGRVILIKIKGIIKEFNYDNFFVKNNWFIWINKQKQPIFTIFVK